MPALNCAADLACQRESSAQQPPSMKTVLIGGEEFRIQQAVVVIGADGEPLAPGSLSGDASAANQATGNTKLESIKTKLDSSNAVLGAPADAPNDSTIYGQIQQTNLLLLQVLGQTGDGAWNGTDPNPTVISLLKSIALSSAATALNTTPA
jgi:hypothetical protein